MHSEDVLACTALCMDLVQFMCSQAHLASAEPSQASRAKAWSLDAPSLLSPDTLGVSLHDCHCLMPLREHERACPEYMPLPLTYLHNALHPQIQNLSGAKPGLGAMAAFHPHVIEGRELHSSRAHTHTHYTRAHAHMHALCMQGWCPFSTAHTSVTATTVRGPLSYCILYSFVLGHRPHSPHATTTTAMFHSPAVHPSIWSQASFVSSRHATAQRKLQTVQMHRLPPTPHAWPVRGGATSHLV